MYRGPWSDSSYATLLDVLAGSYKTWTNVYLIDHLTPYTFETNISYWVTAGQVQMDADADITRTVSLDVFDPDHSLQLDSAAPTDGSLYGDKLIHVQMAVDHWWLGTWGVPVFTGPITQFQRDDASISLTASGKEIYGLDPVTKSWTFNVPYYKLNVVRDCLRDWMHEDWGSIWFDPVINQSLKKKMVMAKGEGKPWEIAKAAAKAMNPTYDLFYSSSGVPHVRKRSNTEVFTITNRHLVSKPQVQYNDDDVLNWWEVLGKKPHGKPRIRAVAQADPSTGVAPKQLGMFGGDRRKPGFFSSDAIGTQKEANDKADSLVADSVRERIEITADMLPGTAVLFEENDLIKIKTPDINHTFRMKKWTHDFFPNSDALGWNDNIRPNRQIIRPRI